MQALWYTLLSVITNRQRTIPSGNERIFHSLQQQLQENHFRDVIETEKTLADKTFKDNVRREKKISRRSDGHYFEAGELLEKRTSKYIGLNHIYHRKFKVNLNNFFPESGQVLCGVTQGSILGHFYSFYI